ncbi:MAG: OmpA family protein [Acidobacteria bacterium]|nr:OmpA family protein [Acidobacteriota bacterium]
MAGLVVIAYLVLALGCASSDDPNRQAKNNAAIGAAVGAVAGAIIGNQTGNPATGAVIGAAAGGGIGYAVGHKRDKMAAEMERIQNLEVQRQQAENDLKVIVNNRILFDLDSAVLQPAALPTLNDMADVLNRYPKARIIVTGYTDSSGDEEHNLKLSERRAQSVANYLISRGVDPSRITAVGLGESDPIDTNQTPQGRQNNRRVEFRIHLEE